MQLREGTTLNTLPHLQPALQYGLGRGYVPLVEWMHAYVAETHAPPNSVWDTCASNGNTDAFAKTCESLLDPGDIVLLEHYVYQPIIGKLRTIEANLVGVDYDEGGMLPASLDATCARLTAAGTPPRVVSIITHGQVRGPASSCRRRTAACGREGGAPATRPHAPSAAAVRARARGAGRRFRTP